MKKLHKDQRGLTIIELLVVIVLTGIITTAITTTFFQVFDMNTRTANHMAALSQVQQAGKLVNEDILQADMIDDSPEGGEFLILGWNSTAVHEVIYTLEDMSGGFKILQRKHYINLALDSTTKVAEYIDPDPTKTSCDWDNVKKVLTFKVTVTVGEETEQRTYRVQPRPGS